MDPSLTLRVPGLLNVSILYLFNEDVSLTTYLTLRGSVTSETIPSTQIPFNQGIASEFATLPHRNDSIIPIVDPVVLK